MPHATSLPDPPPPALRPFAFVGRTILDVVHYLGGMGLLGLSAVRSVVRPRGDAPPLAPAVARHLDRTFRYGLPLVALVHVGLGSFLAMQAYFGATFMDGIGPVVGVGLVRNVAPLMSAMVLGGLLSALYTAELHGPDRDALDRDPTWLPDRDVLAHPEAVEARPPVEPARLAASRMIAAVLAGPVFGIWGALVGIGVGYAVAAGMLNVRGAAFWDMFFQMLWARDVVGVILKGMAFGLVVAWFPCFEGLRHREGPDIAVDTPFAAVRAACLGCCAVLLGNSSWFLLFYHAGPAFGPTLMTPPLS